MYGYRDEQGISKVCEHLDNAVRKLDDYVALSELARMYREGIFVKIDKKFADYLEEQDKKRGESRREYEK